MQFIHLLSNRFTITVLFCCFLSVSAEARYVQPAPSDTDTLKVGLVLSGGGAKGIVHIGILKAIDEAGVRVDYISGTSMGSLLGGLYAIGYSSDQLLDLARSSNWQELFTERVNRRYISNYEKEYDSRTVVTFPLSGHEISLPIGVISGQNIYSLLSRLTWPVHGTESFDQFPIPFATVATDLETGEATVFRSGYLPDAIRASISVPSLMIPHKIGEKYYVDGGLARNLPVEDVIEMGANYVIAIDVSKPLSDLDKLSNFTSIMNQTVGFRISERNREQKELADLVIQPEEMGGFILTDFERTEELIQLGEEIGKKYAEQFKEIAARQNNSAPERPGVGEPVSLPVQSVIIEGNTLLDDEYILRELNFIPGANLSPDLIEEKIIQLYSSRFYDRVTYRIVPDSLDSHNLHIRIFENETDAIRLGLRYETKTQASILVEASYRNLIQQGSITRFDARLGNQVVLLADHIYYGALGSKAAVLTSLQYHAENVDWYVDDIRTSRFRNEIFRSEISAGNFFASQNMISIGLRKDFILHRNAINSSAIRPVSKDYHAFFGRFKIDRLNRKAYPTKGNLFVLDGYYSNDLIFSPLDFSSATLYWNAYYSVTNDVSLKNTLYFGYTTGEQIPWDYWYTPNRYHPVYGYVRFGGFERYEISGRNLQYASVGIQLEPLYHRFIGIDIYTARTLNNWDFDLLGENLNYGASITVGALTILGPIQAVLSTSNRHTFQAELQIGYQF
ncbi:MAG: patatin-like phospholipase family protein [Balneolaceae bacterium]